MLILSFSEVDSMRIFSDIETCSSETICCIRGRRRWATLLGALFSSLGLTDMTVASGTDPLTANDVTNESMIIP